jgi:hypothetical protein
VWRAKKEISNVHLVNYLCEMYSLRNLWKYQMRRALREEWEELNAVIWVCIDLIPVVAVR